MHLKLLLLLVVVLVMVPWAEAGCSHTGCCYCNNNGDVVTHGRYRIELATNLREVLRCPEKALTRALFLLKIPTNAFTIKNHLRHYARQVFKHCK